VPPDDDDKPIHPKRRVEPPPEFDYVGDKQLKKLQKCAWEAGWYPERKKKGIMWFAPDGVGHVMLHGSNSDHHAYKNLRSEFRSAGLDC
jgi:hypothetical protein